jgi:hypothetical protein
MFSSRAADVLESLQLGISLLFAPKMQRAEVRKRPLGFTGAKRLERQAAFTLATRKTTRDDIGERIGATERRGDQMADVELVPEATRVELTLHTIVPTPSPCF